MSSELVAGTPRMSLTAHPGHNWLLTAKVDHQTLHPKISHILPNSGRNSQSKMNGQTKTPKAKLSTRHVDIARTTPSYLLSRDQNNTQLWVFPPGVRWPAFCTQTSSFSASLYCWLIWRQNWLRILHYLRDKATTKFLIRDLNYFMIR